MSVQNGAFTRTNSFGQGGDRNYPRFFIESIQDQLATEREGRPIFRDEERVEIIMPGNAHTRPVMRVTREHQEKWPKEYEAFKKGIEICADGTPLEEWPVLKKSMVLELKALGFQTVEHVASMDDLATQRIGMGGMGLRNRAKAYLDDAEAGKLTGQLQADNNRKDAQIAELSRKVEEMGTLVNRLHGELQGMKNAPDPIAAHIPGLIDPMEQGKHNPESSGGSSLDALSGPRRGRPPKQASA
jgi:hypothetical protein